MQSILEHSIYQKIVMCQNKTTSCNGNKALEIVWPEKCYQN